MRLITFSVRGTGSPRIGVRVARQVLELAAAAQADPAGFAAALLDEREIRFLPPIPDADKFLCAGKNYRTHLEELKRNYLLTETPPEPTGVIKLGSSLCG